MNNRLTELIEQKSFTELSSEEKRFVLSHISEEEYNEKSQTIVQVKEELKSEAKQLNVNANIHSNALAALRAKNGAVMDKEEHKGGAGFFAFKIPLWSAIAAVFMIFVLTTPIFIDNQFNGEDKNDLVASIDTVYIDKLIRDTIEIVKPADTVVKTVYKTIAENDKVGDFVEREDSNSTDFKRNSTGSSDRLQVVRPFQRLDEDMAIGSYANIIDFKNSNSGKSLSEDPIGKVILGVSNWH